MGFSLYTTFFLFKLKNKKNNYYPYKALIQKSISGGLLFCIIISPDNIILDVLWNDAGLNHIVNLFYETFKWWDVSVSTLDIPKAKPSLDITKSTFLNTLHDNYNTKQSIKDVSLRPYTPKFSYVPPVLHFYDTPFYLLGLFTDSIKHKISVSDFMFFPYFYESLKILGNELIKLGPNIIIPSLYSSFIVYTSSTSSLQLNELDASDSHNLDEDQETNNIESDQDQEASNTETDWEYDSDTTQQGWDDNEDHWFYSEPVFYRSDNPDTRPDIQEIRVDLDFTNANYDNWERAATLIDAMELDLPLDYDLFLEINLPDTNVDQLPSIYVQNVRINSNELMIYINSIRADIEFFGPIINEGYQLEDGTTDLLTFHERIRENFMGRYLIMRILERIYIKYNPDYQPYTFSPRSWPLSDHRNS